MPVDLQNPLSFKNATGDADTMLQNLQANILKGHVREHLHILLLQFGQGTEGTAEARAFLTGLAPLVKSAKTHLQEVKAFKENGPNDASDVPYVGVGLTFAGYGRLELADRAPSDEAFKRGMQDDATRQKLGDPEVAQWEAGFQEAIHAVVLVGGAEAGTVTTKLQEVEGLLTGSIRVLGREEGRGMHNANHDGIEHFGYVDGRSQPLFLTEDLEEERRRTDGISVWNPAQPLERVLVADPAAPDPATDFGSYFVLRKLEQNVRAFRQAEEALADALKLENDDRERAGAMLVGRFKDGTPLTLQATPGAHGPVMNNFTYDSDKDAHKCPYQAHIRKTNPRGSGGFGQPPEAERRHLMARRGQTYGERTEGDLPETGVGLLFMAFNSDLNKQFEFTQHTWANNPGFPQPEKQDDPDPGLDQVIGQGDRPPATWPKVWGEEEGQEVPAMAQAVTMKGGEYFFMPSLPFLRGL
ncbi:peroxidase [Streptosporangium nondiastaticum]|uniref:Peroxidase n=1 Tax=Streptosporangium nondiastaticum TaxID=35764 RepID=A0A9X7JVL8_9ACTN|nr:Dyp-type peroxidase [Streptosporangium nondiastaticum]PSJ30561.1 peroxidase [Streptosporangium nondiastaticum]